MSRKSHLKQKAQAPKRSVIQEREAENKPADTPPSINRPVETIRPRRRLWRLLQNKWLLSLVTMIVPILYTKHETKKTIQREEKRAKQVSKETAKEKALNRIMHLECYPENDLKIRVVVPDGFSLHAGKFYLPVHPDPAVGLYSIRQRETILQLEKALRHYESILEQRLEQIKSRSLPIVANRVNLEVPVIGRLRYDTKGRTVSSSDLYYLNCQAEWDAHQLEPKVTLVVMGLGRVGMAKMLESSDATVKPLWDERLEIFEKRVLGIAHKK